MRFVDLRISGFGKFHNLAMEFGTGVNVIYGRNEAGKSTLHSFLRAMLFGLSRKTGPGGKQAPYDYYEPWKSPETYGGNLRIEHEGRIYRIQRDFSKGPDDLHITDETLGRELSDPKAFLSEALSGLTETGYVNTISIGQLKTAAGSGMAAELQRYIANINTTGSLELSAKSAVEYLDRQRENFSDRLSPEAAKSYARAVSGAKTLEAELAKPENENLLAMYTGMREQMRSGILELSEKRKALEERVEKARKVLSENKFTDEDSVLAYEKDTMDIYGDYQRARKLWERRGRLLIPLCLLLLGLLTAFLSVCLLVTHDLYPRELAFGFLGDAGRYLYRFLGPLSEGRFRLLFAGAAGLAVLLVAAALLLLILGRRNKAVYQNTGRMLREILTAQVGKEEIFPETMELFSERMKGFVKLCQAVEKEAAEEKTVSGELLALSEKQNACQEMIDRQQEIQRCVEQKLTELNNYRNQAEEFRKIIAENERLKREIDAIDIAKETIVSLSTALQGSMGAFLNREAGRLLSGLTGGIYQSMDVGRKLDIWLNTRDGMVPLESVSSGTMDQVYLALRLAAVHLIEEKEGSLPLLFDDSFVLYDDDRLGHALGFIAENCSGQILIFSCHHREEEVLSKKGHPYNMIRLRK